MQENDEQFAGLLSFSDPGSPALTSSCMIAVKGVSASCLDGTRQLPLDDWPAYADVSFESLDDLQLLRVFWYLDTRERIACAAVCRRWRLLITEPLLWHSIIAWNFPTLRSPQKKHPCAPPLPLSPQLPTVPPRCVILLTDPAFSSLRRLDLRAWHPLLQPLLSAGCVHELHTLYLKLGAGPCPFPSNLSVFLKPSLRTLVVEVDARADWAVSPETASYRDPNLSLHPLTAPHLASLTYLTHLSLDRAADHHLVQVATFCPHLCSLRLDTSPVSDSALAVVVSHCPNLRALFLASCPRVSGAWASSLPHPSPLQILWLGTLALRHDGALLFPADCAHSDGSVTSMRDGVMWGQLLRRTQNLQCLKFSHYWSFHLSPAAIRVLSSCLPSSLLSLSLPCYYTPADTIAATLSLTPSLEHLCLSNSLSFDPVIPLLSTLTPRLRVLCLRGSHPSCTLSLLSPLLSLPSLTQLHLAGFVTRIDPALLPTSSPSPLRRLRITECTGVTCDVVSALVRACHMLSRVELDYQTAFLNVLSARLIRPIAVCSVVETHPPSDSDCLACIAIASSCSFEI